MLRIQIKNSSGIVTNENIVETELAANEWYDYNVEHFPSPHTKSITSMEEERLDALRDKESDEAVELGTRIIKQIRKINRRKLKLGLLTSARFGELLASQTATQIERALWNGSLSTAAMLLTNMSDFYSDLEIGPIVAMIQAHETKWIELI